MNASDVSNWIAICTTITAVIALVLSYLSYRRDQDIRRETLRDQETSQARMVTAWWTRIDEDNQDVTTSDTASTVWPEETGYRIWVSNSSDDAAYECDIDADSQLTDEGMTELEKKGYIARPYMVGAEKNLLIGIGTLPPKTQIQFRLDRSIIDSVGILTISFRDANGVKWQRRAGTLTRQPSGDEMKAGKAT